jgi:uncharacterized protein YkwD
MHGWCRIMSLGLAGALALAGCASSNAAGKPQAPRTGADAVAHPSRGTAALEREVYELVNRHRKARGLAPLALDARVGEQARRHSVAMATGKTPAGHKGFDDRVRVLARTMSCRRSAENVGFNQGYDEPAAAVVRGWLASHGHRENIEGPYDLTGVGVARNAAGEVYFTQMFIGR